MAKLVFRFFVLVLLASPAHAEYECTTNPYAEGCQPPSQSRPVGPTITNEQIDAALYGQTARATITTSAQATASLTQLQEMARERDAVLLRAQQATDPQTKQALLAEYNVLAGRTQKVADDLRSEAARQAAEIAKNAKSPCDSVEEKAVSVCTLGLDPIQEAQLRGAMSTATALMQSGGSYKACKAAKLVQTLSMGANFAHAASCGAAIKSCTSYCAKEVIPKLEAAPATDLKSKAELPLAKASLLKCEKLEQNAVASVQSGFQNIIGMATSGQCQKALTTTNPGGGSTPPTAMDCSNPAMASMPSCVCAANPGDPVCTASNGGLGDGGGFSSVGDGSSAVDGAKDPEMFGFGDEIPQLEASNGGAGGAGQGSSGGGGGMNGGSGAGALPPEESGGPGTGPYNTDVMGGLAGGGGSGGGSSYGRGGGEGSGGGGLLDGLAEKFNLKGFLPNKADFKNRGLASGTGADGITGPNGPSLFEKVSARYQKKQSELLP